MKVGIGKVARGIADALTRGGYFTAVYPTPNPGAAPFSAMVVMAGGTAQTYSAAALRFDVVLHAPLTDYLASLDWISEGIEAVGAALKADPKCGGACTGVTVESFAEVYSATLNGVDVLAVLVRLSPTYAT